MILDNSVPLAAGSRLRAGVGWAGQAAGITLALALLVPGDIATTLRVMAAGELWHSGSPLLPGFGLSLRLSLAVALGAVVIWLPLALLAGRHQEQPLIVRLLAACEQLGVRWGGVPLLLVAVVGLGRAGAFLGAQRAIFPFAAAHGARDEGFWALVLVYLIILLPLAGLGLGASLGRARLRGSGAVGSAPALLTIALLLVGATTLAQLASCQPAQCLSEHGPALLVDAYRSGDVPLSPLFGQALALLLVPTVTSALLLSRWWYAADERWKQQMSHGLGRWVVRVLGWLLRH